MVRRSVVVVVLAIALVIAGCSSDGGSDAAPLPQLTRKDWTPAGLATARATVGAITQGLPGQCTDAGVSDFSALASNMQMVHSTIEPTAQMTCNVNDEVVEISVFATTRDRDRFVDDRSNGLCRLAKAQAEKHKSRFVFPGLRWDLGAGNVTVQPDSESLARRLSLATGGRYDGRSCPGSITSNWDTTAINAVDALAKRIGHGCDFVDLVPRESLDRSNKLTDTQLPAAYGSCSFDGSTIQIVTFSRSTPQVKTFIDQRVRQACAGDPAAGRIDGNKFTVVAAGTVAERVHATVGASLPLRACG
jgi:hypothetical protein